MWGLFWLPGLLGYMVVGGRVCLVLLSLNNGLCDGYSAALLKNVAELPNYFGTSSMVIAEKTSIISGQYKILHSGEYWYANESDLYYVSNGEADDHQVS